MRNQLGDVRRSQVITTHGPGAIIDFRAGGYGGAGISVVGAGLEAWDEYSAEEGLGHGQTVYEPRLQRELGVEGFRLPPVAPQSAPGRYPPRADKLVGVRFPRWLQCPECHVLRLADRWGHDPGDPALYCRECSRNAGGQNRVHVFPVRFLMICDYGHLDEFPWQWWIPHTEKCSQDHDLELKGSATAGLAGLELKCKGCNAARSMEGCFNPNALPRKCQGKRPWLGVDADEDCPSQEGPRVVQRGASNIHFAVQSSALDIPPWSDDLQKQIGFRWATLKQARDDTRRRDLIEAFRLPERTGRSADDLLNEINARIQRLEDPERNIRWEEYQQFARRGEPFGENTEFEIRPDTPPPELSKWLSTVVRATRLREVRALRGFTRVAPPTHGDDSRVAGLSVERKDWLPGIENRGEGIFLEVHMDSLREWERRDDVRRRVEWLNKTYRAALSERGRSAPPREMTPRLLLVHTLAHALIRQFALSCGYGSTALRERLYVGEAPWEMAGVLIYTSSPDADGTLGGLAEQGRAKNIVKAFEGSLKAMSWCASDPLCIEGVHATSDPGNGAACHACGLVAETSCEEFNGFLDRAMLVGAPDEPYMGYFRDYVEQDGGL